MTVAAEDTEFLALLDKIARDRRFQCRSYKDKCLRRRITVRLRARGVANFSEYARLLDHDVREYDKLIDTLTINVTKLFRNWESYEALSRLVIPTLWASATPTINIWSAGCASGDETYSLSILLHRHAAEIGDAARFPKRLSTLGTDIDRSSLLAAARGLFPEPSFQDTPPEIRTAYFSVAPPLVGVGGIKHPQWSVSSLVRQVTRFERHDLLEEAHPTGQHLICCRNVIIYFDRETQESLFARFHAALSPGGYLMLGKVETLLGASRTLFAPVDARERIFRRI